MLSVGEILQKTREKRGLSVLQVEKETRIRRQFLQAVENNDWTSFTSKIYIVGIIRNYSRFLGLDPQKTLAFFRRDYEKADDTQFKKGPSVKRIVSDSRRFATAALVVIFFLFSAYFGYQLKMFLTPPEIALISPLDERFRSTERIRIVGQTEKESSITIYGEKVFQNKDGRFEYDLPLKKGSNEVIIEVIGPNGKKSTLRRVYILE